MTALNRTLRALLARGLVLWIFLSPTGCGKDDKGAWAVQAGGPDHPSYGGDVGTDMAVAADGSLYVTGIITGSGRFGSGHKGAFELRSIGYLWRSVFLARYTPRGTLKWVARVATTGEKADGARVTALPGGDAMVAGYCHRRSDIGGGTGTAIRIECAQESNLFLARYRSDGRPAWAINPGGTGAIEIADMATGPDGSTILAGTFTDRLVFGRGQANQTVLLTAKPGMAAVFLARFQPDGTLGFAKGFVGSDQVRAGGLSRIGGDRLVIAGSFTDRVTFGPGSAIESAGDEDFFLAAFNWDGTPSWAVRSGSAGKEVGKKVAAIDDQTAAVLGEDADGGFVARYDQNGDLRSLFRVPGTSLGLDAHPGGQVAVTGRFLGEAIFGPGESHETALSGAGDAWREDAFVALFEPDNTLAWAVRGGGPEYITDHQGTVAIGDCGVGVAIDPSGRALYGTGYFYGDGTFELSGSRDVALTSAGGFDAFIWRLQR